MPVAAGGSRYMAVVADPTAGLGPLPAGWGAAAHDVTVSGLPRTYLTVAPTSLTGRVPVVVLMHGAGMTAAGVLALTGLAAQTGPAVIVAPEGWEESWDAGGCCGPAGRAGINDVGFIRTALQQVLGSYPQADPTRVYAAGFSNGGRMAYRLACDMPGTFAGFAAAEAVPVENCSALHPLSVLIIAQGNDPVLAVGAADPPRHIDGMAEPTVAAVVARERAMDGCAGSPTVTYAGVAERSVWHCAAGTRFTYVWYPGGAHSWRAPIGATPGSTDMVLSLMGGQLVSDRSVPGPSAPDRPAPGPTSTTASTSVPAPEPTTSTTVPTTVTSVPPGPA
jgi:polyhydroxybutyrate depolymerase